MKKLFKLLVFIAIAGLISCKRDSAAIGTEAYRITGTADSRQLVPSVAVAGTATLDGWYEKEMNSFTFTLSWADLWNSTSKDVITGVKFFGPATANENGTLKGTVNFVFAETIGTGSMKLGIGGSTALSDADRKELIAGKWYYVITTEKFPNGIVRGALTSFLQDPNTPSIIKVMAIAMNQANKSVLKVGDKSTMLWTVQPTYATNKMVSWQSSDPGIASVDQQGLVTAIKPGLVTVTVSATDGSGVKAQFIVAVNYTLQETEISRSGFSITCSSEKVSDGGGAVAALDGNFNTYWHSMWAPDAPLPHWLLVDMKQPFAISKVNVRRRTGNTDTKTVVVAVSMDNVNFKTVGTINCTADNNFLSFTSEQCQYVRFTVTASNRSPYANVSELNFYEFKWIAIP